MGFPLLSVFRQAEPHRSAVVPGQSYELASSQRCSYIRKYETFLRKRSPAIKRKRVDDVDNISVRLLLSPEEVGALLGPQGERIKTVKREHKCFVKINEETCAGSSDRICIIRGDVPNVISGVGALIRSIAEYRSSEVEWEHDVTRCSEKKNRRLAIRYESCSNHFESGKKDKQLPRNRDSRKGHVVRDIEFYSLCLCILLKHIGAVIGRKGHVVRDIEFYSLCKVQVGKEATTDCRRLIRITGTEENLDIAKMMVERVVNEYYISNLLSALHASSSQ
ncbi:hypothetical protein GCK32_011875 [Trichostrongylus colubriformis]|uniref:K Homology domain-containing protein n=1 Tax=Trichostrongylus colubriformis TaxID=6319 RepID=A0AAN8ETK0_TRICO